MERERHSKRRGRCESEKWMNEQARKGQTKEFCIYMILLFPYILILVMKILQLLFQIIYDAIAL
jgi:hypothetical protein